MTYQEKVDWLLSYRRQENKVQELEQEMKELQQVLENQRALCTQGRGEWLRERQEREATAIRERQLVLAKEQRRMTALADAIEIAIKRLEEPRQRRVLRQIYLAGMSQNQVCEQFHYCKRQVSRSHTEGVRELQLCLEDLRAGDGV